MSIKLHLGCGKRKIEGFIHIDNEPHEHLTHIRDIRDLSIFEDNTVDLIYSSHAFEYFHNPAEVLQEWKRVLKPHGVLRLSVPDFAKLVKVYRKTDDITKVIGPLFGHWGNKQHYTCYDKRSLGMLLWDAGFSSIEEWDWRLTEHCNVDDYSQAYFPHMDKENGIQISLNIQAIK